MPLLPKQSGWQMHLGLITGGVFADTTVPTVGTALYTVRMVGLDSGDITLSKVRLVNDVATTVEVSLLKPGTPCVIVHDEKESTYQVFPIGTETILFNDCGSEPPGDSVGTKIVSFFKGLVGKN